MTKKEYADYCERFYAFMEREGLANLSQVDSETDSDYSSYPCDCCKRLAGDRHECNGFNPATNEVQDGYSVCEDCVYFAEYGQLGDQTMMDVEADDTPPDCPKCGAEMDKDCFGGHRCEECDPPCPGCYDRGMDAQEADDDNEGYEYDPEDGQDAPDEPDEEDLFTEDHATFWFVGKPVVRVGSTEQWEDVVRQWMDSEGYYPNVWYVDDHGGVALITPALGNGE